jgi:hypothetical protein
LRVWGLVIIFPLSCVVLCGSCLVLSCLMLFSLVSSYPSLFSLFSLVLLFVSSILLSSLYHSLFSLFSYFVYFLVSFLSVFSLSFENNPRHSVLKKGSHCPQFLIDFKTKVVGRPMLCGKKYWSTWSLRLSRFFGPCQKFLFWNIAETNPSPICGTHTKTHEKTPDYPPPFLLSSLQTGFFGTWIIPNGNGLGLRGSNETVICYRYHSYNC